MSTTNKSLSSENNVEAGNAGPDVFDGFRYSRLRELPGLESKHQAASTSLVSSLSSELAPDVLTIDPRTISHSDMVHTLALGAFLPFTK